MICTKTTHTEQLVDLLDGTRHDGCTIRHCVVIMSGADVMQAMGDEWLSFVLHGCMIERGHLTTRELYAADPAAAVLAIPKGDR